MIIAEKSDNINNEYTILKSSVDFRNIKGD